MNAQQLNYLIKESFRTIGRHKGISSISVVIMSLTLLILAVFLLATDNMLMFLGRAKQEMRVYVYIEDTVPPDVIEKYQRRILSMPEVDQIIFVSKDEALHEFQAEIGEDNDILGALESNPLPASFRITLKDEYKNKDKVVRFATQLQELDGIEEVRYGKDFLEKFTSITRGFFFVDAFVGMIVILSSIFIISNAVRLSVVSRKRNIEILKLVGATNRFITMPFIIEGALQGAIASLCSTCLLFVIFLVGDRFLPELSFFSLEKTVVYILLCIFIGALGSSVALRRFLQG
jgi:cell division transport system permease protein